LHPETNFVAAHVGESAEHLDRTASVLDTYPNVMIDMSARVAELGRQPYRAATSFCALLIAYSSTLICFPISLCTGYTFASSRLRMNILNIHPTRPGRVTGTYMELRFPMMC
jgi:hypothetical protein